MEHRDQSDGYPAQPVEVVAVKPGLDFGRGFRSVHGADVGRAGREDRHD
jgi:hypothetical protein